MKSRLIYAVCTCIFILISVSANAVIQPLEGRLPVTPGGTDYQAYYNPNLDITWAANANEWIILNIRIVTNIGVRRIKS